jgi:uncharacterized membrane protein
VKGRLCVFFVRVSWFISVSALHSIFVEADIPCLWSIGFLILGPYVRRALYEKKTRSGCLLRSAAFASPFSPGSVRVLLGYLGLYSFFIVNRLFIGEVALFRSLLRLKASCMLMSYCLFV